MRRILYRLSAKRKKQNAGDNKAAAEGRASYTKPSSRTSRRRLHRYPGVAGGGLCGSKPQEQGGDTFDGVGNARDAPQKELKSRFFLSRRTTKQARLVELGSVVRTLHGMTRPRTGL